MEVTVSGSPVERRLRRMYRQQSPVIEIIADWRQVRTGSPQWATVEGQAMLLRAIECPASTEENAPCPRHRAALLTGVLRALKQTGGTTPCASLMAAYHSSRAAEMIRRAAQSTGTAESELKDINDKLWSGQTFQLAPDRFIQLRVRDCIGGPQTGTRVWDSEIALSAWLVARPADQWAGRHVLALGAGCGLAGIVLALHASSLGSLSLTDNDPDVIANLRRNCRRNLPLFPRVWIGMLDWEHPHESAWLRATAGAASHGSSAGYEHPHGVAPGALMRLEGLVSRADLNGTTCSVLRFLLRSGRWFVQYEATDAEQGGLSTKRISVKSANLHPILVPPSPEADTIVAADVIYEPDLVEPLVTALALLLRTDASVPTKKKALIALEIRGESWSAFKAAVEHQQFEVINRSDEVRFALRDSSCPFWFSPLAIDGVVLLELSLNPDRGDWRGNGQSGRRNGQSPVKIEWPSAAFRCTTSSAASALHVNNADSSQSITSGSHSTLKRASASAGSTIELLPSLDDDALRLLCARVPLEHHPMLRATCSKLRDLVTWGRTEALASYVARYTGSRRTIDPERAISCMREAAQDIKTDMFFEPEAFAMLQYAAEAKVVESLAIQWALLRMRGDRSKPDAEDEDSNEDVVNGSDEDNDSKNELVLRSAEQAIDNPNASKVSSAIVGHLPGDCGEWWTKRMAVHHFFEFDSMEEQNGGVFQAMNLEVVHYREGDPDPDYEWVEDESDEEGESGEEGEEESEEDGEEEEDGSDEEEEYEYDSSADTRSEEDDEPGQGATSASHATAIYKLVREAIERDAIAESGEHRRFGRLPCAQIYDACEDEDEDEDEEQDDYEVVSDVEDWPVEEGADWSRYLVPRNQRPVSLGGSLSMGRHIKFLRGDWLGITSRELCRLAGRGGVQTMQGSIFGETRFAFKSFLEMIMRPTLHHQGHIHFADSQRTGEYRPFIIRLMDVVWALKYLDTCESTARAFNISSTPGLNLM